MCALFRDESPQLGVSTSVDDLVSLTGTATVNPPAIPSKITGAWVESFSPLAAPTSFAAFIAPYAVRVLAVVERHGTAASGAGTLQLEATPSGTAVGSGTALLTGTIALNGTANTNLAGTPVANPVVPAGSSLSLVFATTTALANAVVSITLQKV